MHIWIVLYEHKHGNDFSAFESEEDANQGCLDLVREYREEFDIDPKISDEDALESWPELTGGMEFISIHRTKISNNLPKWSKGNEDNT